MDTLVILILLLVLLGGGGLAFHVANGLLGMIVLIAVVLLVLRLLQGRSL